MQKPHSIEKFLKQTNYHASWHHDLTQALQQMDASYVDSLLSNQQWLPGIASIFNALSLPKDKVNYLLIGESPYPRAQSANGYAFWDQAVGSLWSKTGLSKEVNRATSLRNFIKMLLLADKKLKAGKTQQPDIAKIDKSQLIETNTELFEKLIEHGFLLLNASPVLSKQTVRKEAKQWQPFLGTLLNQLSHSNPDVMLILLGKIAEDFNKLGLLSRHKRLCAEHPYNISFISNQQVIDFFKPFKLLNKTSLGQALDKSIKKSENTAL